MNSKTIRTLVVGAVAAYVVTAAVLASFVELGALPVQADVAPSRVEAKLFGHALHASVAWHAPTGGNPMPASEDNLAAGAALYRQMCSRCHGLSSESENSYGRSFYPPAPRLAFSRPTYSDTEMFWIIKHGVRNTGMPAWGNLLSDDEIWRVVTLLREFNSLPDSATAELLGHQ
jgi:mono/diheme cytochrome c family protein